MTTHLKLPHFYYPIDNKKNELVFSLVFSIVYSN